MVGLKHSATIADLVEVAVESGYSRFPVTGHDTDDIVGIVEVKDVFAMRAEEREHNPLSQILRPAVIVPEHRELDGVLLDLEVAKSRLAVVVDEHGGTAGLITREDILEELVGDISDEYDEPLRTTGEKKDGRYILDGLKSRGDVEDLIGLRLPEGPYETIAGFLLERFGSIPLVGDRLEWESWRFEILRMDNLRISEGAVENKVDVRDSLADQGETQ